jgi:hypothetical protein
VRVTLTHQANVISSISGQQTQANDKNHTTGERRYVNTRPSLVIMELEILTAPGPM